MTTNIKISGIKDVKKVKNHNSKDNDYTIPDKVDQFAQTRIRFREFSGYTKPLTYDEWMEAPDECKAAILYVQFYSQITLAWMKTKSVYSDVNDGVSEVLQYLNKNVEKIKNDGKRFTPNYIYKVAYNCLYCLCRDPNRYRRAFDNECSNLVGYGDDELDLFETVKESDEVREAKFDVDGTREYLYNATQLWNIIDEMGHHAKLVVAKLLGENCYPVKEMDSISDEETAQILMELRNRLSRFVEVFG